MKAYTDLEQSRKLAEILPHESADMWYDNDGESIAGRPEVRYCSFIGLASMNIPCWSLAALLDVLNKTAYFIDEDASVNLSPYKAVEWYLGIDNSDLEFITKADPVDACYEMILILKENNLL